MEILIDVVVSINWIIRVNVILLVIKVNYIVVIDHFIEINGIINVNNFVIILLSEEKVENFVFVTSKNMFNFVIDDIVNQN